jgi:hypothetical protein
MAVGRVLVVPARERIDLIRVSLASAPARRFVGTIAAICARYHSVLDASRLKQFFKVGVNSMTAGPVPDYFDWYPDPPKGALP